MERVVSLALYTIVVFAAVYQMAAILYPLQGALEFYYFHLGLVLVIVTFDIARTKAGESDSFHRGVWLAILSIVGGLAIGASAYLYLNIGEIEFRQPFITEVDFAAGAILIGCVLVLTYLVWGGILTGVIALGILYFIFGDLLSGAMHYRPPESEIIMSYLAGMGGARGVIWGIPLSANTLFLIIVFGGLLKGTRILELFNEVGKLLLAVSRGGICYSSILASTAIGMVTGQAVANVALSGSVTIPSMKQRGLSGAQAGAVEVVSSLGSQIIPPIMGLGGFLMAVNLGVPYADIATAAIIPAVLFIAILFVAAYFLAESIPSLKIRSESVDKGSILWMLPSFLTSFGTLLALLYLRFSPGYAAFWAILLLVSLSFARPAAYRPTFNDLFSGLVYGVVSAANLGLILAGIGILIQVLVTTGAGFNLGRIIMLAAGDNVGLALVLGMVLSLIIGLGLPTPAAYALSAIIMIPFLVDMGVTPIVAHFFGFYFAIFSAVTPPVAVGVMAATRISGASFYETVIQSGKMALVPVLIPFTFVAYPNVLEFPAITVETTVVCLALLATTAMWGASIYGVIGRHLNWLERSGFLLGPALYLALLITKDLIYAAPILVVATAMVVLRVLVAQRQRGAVMFRAMTAEQQHRATETAVTPKARAAPSE